MTLRLNPNLTLAVAGTIGIGVAAIATAPQQLGAALAFGGGLIGGAGIGRERAIRQKRNEEAATRVTACFTALYEANRGVVDPMQLGILANIPGDQAHAFLTGLAENTNGQKITVKQGAGVVFAFPHSQSALDELTINARKWAEAQTQQLNAELTQHKQALQYIQLQQAAAAIPKTPAPTIEPSPWENVAPPS
jgi:hypothetical protein